MRLISASILDFDQDAIGYTRAERLGLEQVKELTTDQKV
jgi:hypothetical protein